MPKRRPSHWMSHLQGPLPFSGNDREIEEIRRELQILEEPIGDNPPEAFFDLPVRTDTLSAFVGLRYPSLAPARGPEPLALIARLLNQRGYHVVRDVSRALERTDAARSLLREQVSPESGLREVARALAALHPETRDELRPWFQDLEGPG